MHFWEDVNMNTVLCVVSGGKLPQAHAHMSYTFLHHFYMTA